MTQKGCNFASVIPELILVILVLYFLSRIPPGLFLRRRCKEKIRNSGEAGEASPHFVFQ